MVNRDMPHTRRPRRHDDAGNSVALQTVHPAQDKHAEVLVAGCPKQPAKAARRVARPSGTIGAGRTLGSFLVQHTSRIGPRVMPVYAMHRPKMAEVETRS